MTTYQALASEFKAGRGEVVAERLAEAGIATLVVDEAHHLRNFWWRCLDRLKERLEPLRVVALTATPPYDVAGGEWRRYADLCGPVDEEIGIPELVRAGDLCPHQDYVYLCTPRQDHAAELARFRGRAAALVSDLALGRAPRLPIEPFRLERRREPAGAEPLTLHG